MPHTKPNTPGLRGESSQGFWAIAEKGKEIQNHEMLKTNSIGGRGE